jgi:DNA-binding response OmpR family regulator
LGAGSVTADYRRPHVLIVSDDLGLSQFLNEGLVIAGFWASVVASSLQTLELFRLRTFDVMLVDVALEGLGVEELLRRLLEPAEDGSPRTDIPILAVAGDPREVTQPVLKLVGPENVVLAPIEIETLAAQLFQVVRGWRAAHPDRPWADEIRTS